MRDEDLRSSCFARLELLRARFGVDIPYTRGLDEGFPFRGRRVPFLNRQKGIHRAAAQDGPAALSIVTSVRSPYGDAVTPEGLLYAYRAGHVNQADNRALRAALDLRVPMVYFIGTRAGWYDFVFPAYIVADDPAERRVLVTFGQMTGPLDEREPVLVEDPLERRYAVRQVLARVHQRRFRGRVVPAYANQCAICRLKETRLLDAAHIVGDLDPAGEAVVRNGLSLCTIHHRAFDHDLVGISPEYDVRISRRLLDDVDGPMLDLLKRFHGEKIEVPRRRAWRPDPERLAIRFEQFQAAG